MAVLVGLVLVLAGGLAFPVAADPVDTSRTNQSVAVVVIFESPDGVNESAITALDGTVTGGRSLDLLPVLFARIDPRMIPELRRHPDVRRVVRDRDVSRVARDRDVTRRSADRTGNSSVTRSAPWGVVRIGARKAESAVGSDVQDNVTVAVLDTGIDYTHEDLAPNVVWGVDVVGPIEYGVAAADDVTGHGTHVAGIIAARDNDVGVVGVAPHVKLYSIQVLGRSGGSVSDVVQGIDQALKGPDGEIGTADDADVISMSLGSSHPSPVERRAIIRATEHSTVVVAAAGNTGDGDPSTTEVLYPAAYPETIAVAAVGPDNRTPTFSSDGSAVDIAAPGTRVVSTVPDDKYRQSSGTSMATPHVSGTVALVIARDTADGSRDLGVDDVRTRLQTTAQDIGLPGEDRFSGHGLVRADRAVPPTPVPLAISANRSRITVGESVSFTVYRADTGRSVSGLVRIGATVYHVGQNGSVTHTFRTAGSVTVRASKSDAGGQAFVADGVKISVSPGDVTGSGTRATDTDGDGRFDDVNGDGTASVVDVQALFAALSTDAVQNNEDAFDFNGDGTVDVVDVQRLFRLVTSRRS